MEEIKISGEEISDPKIPDDIVADEPLLWDDIIDARTDAVDELVSKQLLFKEFIDIHQDKLNKDKDAFKIVDGTLKTFEDIAIEIKDLGLEHATLTNEVELPGGVKIEVAAEFRKGIIDTEDDEKAYLKIATGYVQATEKVAYIASTAFLDVFSKLGLETKELKNVIDICISENEEIMKNEVKNG